MLTLAGSVRRQAQGMFPTICMNRNGIILEAHQPSYASQTMYYQVGTLRKNDVNFTERRPLVGSGKFPKVAINDDNLVVEVHEAVFTRDIYFNFGVLDDQRVEWQNKISATYLAPGRFPNVAVRGRRVIVTHDRARFLYQSYYRIGTINERGTTIGWSNQMPLFPQSGISETSVSLNDEFAVAVGHGWSRILCIVGRIQDNGADIEWTNEIEFDCNGYWPSVCLDNADRTIMVWQSLFGRRLGYAEGTIVQDDQQLMINWEERRNYDYGCNPTVTLAPHNGQVVEEHETNFGRSLHIHVGKLHEPQQDQDELRQDDAGEGEEDQPGNEENQDGHNDIEGDHPDGE